MPSRYNLPAIAAVLAYAAACAPPPEIDATGDPEIRLLYPDGDVPITVDIDGLLQFLVVVDMVNIEFTTPGPDNPLVDGQGHWHLSLNDVYVDAPLAFHYDISQSGWATGDAVKITATLQDNEHADLDQFDGWEAIHEFTIQ